MAENGGSPLDLGPSIGHDVSMNPATIADLRSELIALDKLREQLERKREHLAGLLALEDDLRGNSRLAVERPFAEQVEAAVSSFGRPVRAKDVTSALEYRGVVYPGEKILADAVASVLPKLPGRRSSEVYRVRPGYYAIRRPEGSEKQETPSG